MDFFRSLLDLSAKDGVDVLPDGFFIRRRKVLKCDPNTGGMVSLIFGSPPGDLSSYVNGFMVSGEGEFQMEGSPLRGRLRTDDKTSPSTYVRGKGFVMLSAWLSIGNPKRGLHPGLFTVNHASKFNASRRFVNIGSGKP
jgi:hypothetical protein